MKYIILAIFIIITNWYREWVYATDKMDARAIMVILMAATLASVGLFIENRKEAAKPKETNRADP